jgi:hypothetical protein
MRFNKGLELQSISELCTVPYTGAVEHTHLLRPSLHVALSDIIFCIIHSINP